MNFNNVLYTFKSKSKIDQFIDIIIKLFYIEFIELIIKHNKPLRSLN